jgi:hypothetical protein
MPKPSILKFKEGLKDIESVNPDATFQPKSKVKSKTKSRSPSRSVSPSRSKSPVSLPIPLPGEPSEEDSFEFRSVVSRPSAEKYANTDILKKNPVVSMEELSIILGITKISLPKVDTKVKPVTLPKMDVSPKRSSPKAKSPRAKSPKKSCNIMLGDKPIDKAMISNDRSTKTRPVYKIEELKEIAKQLLISSTGTKEVLVSSILKELESRGC